MCYRAALHRRRASASIAAAAAAGHSSTKDWCVLSFNYRNMCSSSDVVSSQSAPSSRLNSRSSSPTSSTGASSSSSSGTSPSNSLKSGLDISLGSSKSSLESVGHRRGAAGNQHSPVQSLESLQQCDDNDNVVPNRNNSTASSHNSGGAHFKCRKALGNI